MSILSFVSSSQGISIIHSTSRKSSFSILDTIHIPVVPGDWVALAKALESVIQSRNKANRVNCFIIAKAAAGKYSAAPDTYKAEGIIEYVLSNMGHPVTYISKLSFSKELGCAKKEKWQDKAVVMFNGGGTIKGFAQGFNAACAGAWSAAT